jgi:hypothetical protein
MKKVLALASLLPLCAHAMQQVVFDGKAYLQGQETIFNPNAYVDYKKGGQISPVRGAGLVPLVRDEEGKLHVILPQAIVGKGTGEENGKSLVYFTPSQDSAFDGQYAVPMAAPAEELQILDRETFDPEKVEAAIYKTKVALPGNSLIRGGFYGTVTYVAEFDLSVQQVRGFCYNVQPQLDAIAAIVDPVEETKAYNKLFPTSAQIERSDRIKSFHVVPFGALLGAITKAQDEAAAQNSWIQAPVEVPGYGAVASYVARTLALQLNVLARLK